MTMIVTVALTQAGSILLATIKAIPAATASAANTPPGSTHGRRCFRAITPGPGEAAQIVGSATNAHSAFCLKQRCGTTSGTVRFPKLAARVATCDTRFSAVRGPFICFWLRGPPALHALPRELHSDRPRASNSHQRPSDGRCYRHGESRRS